MTSQNNVQVTIALHDSDLNEGELQEAAENLLQQIVEVGGVEQANLVAADNPPEGSKSLVGFLGGMLTAEINPANIKALFQFLGDRLGNKTIEMEVEANGRKLKIKASSQQELQAALKAAQEFLAG